MYRRVAVLIALMCFFTVLTLSAGDKGSGKKSSKGFTVTKKKDLLLFALNKRPVFSYQFDNVPYKPYVKKLYSPRGINILRDSPFDHKHHHALMYAIMVNGVNFWEENANPGRELHKSLTTNIKGNSAGFRETLSWINTKNKEPLLDETRIVRTVCRKDLGATFLIWETKLSVPEGKTSVKLTGNHYHGLGMRFLISMDEGGTFRNSENRPGKVFRGTERLGKAKWCSYTAKANGKLVTVAMFGDPKNLRAPTLWFTMTKPFAYLSATLNLHIEPVQLKTGKPLSLRYGIALWDGNVKTQKIDALTSKWINW